MEYPGISIMVYPAIVHRTDCLRIRGIEIDTASYSFYRIDIHRRALAVVRRAHAKSRTKGVHQPPVIRIPSATRRS